VIPWDTALKAVRDGPAREDQEARYERVFRQFYERVELDWQAQVLDAKAFGDGAYSAGLRALLTRQLLRLNIDVTSEIGSSVLSSYRPGLVLAYLQLHSAGQAERITVDVLDRIQAVTTGVLQRTREVLAEGMAEMFQQKKTSGSVRLAESLVTEARSRGAFEAAKQAVNDGRQVTKTWNVTSLDPRRSHAAINGETVGVEERFSNGLRFPGDPDGDIDETAGCKCRLQIKIQEG